VTQLARKQADRADIDTDLISPCEGDLLEEHADGSTLPNENGKTQNALPKLISANELSWTDSTGAIGTKLLFRS
jgi:hypothetical protein